MERVLLLDTSFAARPIHDWLCKQNFEVWTIGNRASDVLARRDPAHYIQENYADCAAVQRHVDNLEIDFVVPGCTDVSIETALRLKGIKTVFDLPETYHRLADKAAFRALCEEINLPAPQRVELSEIPYDGLLISKPSDSFSGRGISVFDGRDQAAAEAALKLAGAESRTGTAFLETYVEGQLYSFSGFLQESRVSEAVMVREDGSQTAFAVDTSHVVFDFPNAGKLAVQESIERLAAELSLVDGLIHVQFIWDGEQPWLIELCRRCPGDLYPRLIELSTGQPYAARYASYFVNREVGFSQPSVQRHVLRHTITAGHENFEGLWFHTAEPVLEYHPLALAGREPVPPGRQDRVAVVFMEYSSARQLVEKHDLFLDRKAYQTRI